METVFLTFFHSRIAGHEACRFKRGTIFGVRYDERSRDTVTDSSRLSGRTAASYVDRYVELIESSGQIEGLTDYELQGLESEVIVDASLVDDDVTFAAGNEAHAGNSFFTSAGSPVLYFLFNDFFRCHISPLDYLSLSASGFCASCLCSGPLYTKSLLIIFLPMEFFGSMPFTALRTANSGLVSMSLS